MLRKYGPVMAAAVVLLLVIPMMASANGGDVHACVHDANGKVKIVDEGTECVESWSLLTWGIQGPAGVDGADGTDGVLGFYTNSEEFNVPAGLPFTYKVGQAFCDAGDTVTGGGFSTLDLSLQTEESLPIAGGWQIGVVNDHDTQDYQAYVYVVCADITS